IILDEPFRTAARTLQDIASIEIRSQEEARECQRQLAQAFDNFAKARSYAEKDDDPDRLQFISIYQSLTAALIPGGRPFAELYLAPLQERVANWRAQAAELQKQADAINSDPSTVIKEWREYEEECQRALTATPYPAEAVNFPRVPASVIAEGRERTLRADARN